MRILAVDVGTGTQDILLYDTTKEPENALKMIMPSPTRRVAQEIREATASGASVLLTGVTMGGGPCGRAADEHLQAGYQVYATPDAACTFDDDLQVVAQQGVRIVSADEAKCLRGVRTIVMRDLDLQAISHAFHAFGVALEPDALGVAVFDHGAAPPGYSDRRFRFEYLAERLKTAPSLTALAFPASEVPERMTRMRAVAREAPADIPLLLMDTPSAAILGAQLDPAVSDVEEQIAVNIGNGHTLAFRLRNGQVTGLFEHHSGKLRQERLEELIDQLAAGTIDNDEIYSDGGHGALLLDDRPMSPRFVSVTGPRRGMLSHSRHNVYFAVPHGDMMVAGCWGLVHAMQGWLSILAREP